VFHNVTLYKDRVYHSVYEDLSYREGISSSVIYNYYGIKIATKYVYISDHTFLKSNIKKL